MVVIGTMNNPGTVLLTIADMSVIEAEVDVDETDIPGVKNGQIVKITIDAFPDKTFAGRVTEIGNSPIQASGAPVAQATNFQVVVTSRHRDPRRASWVHVHGRDHNGHAQPGDCHPDSGHHGPRDGRRREGRDRAGTGTDPDRRRRPGGVQASELKPGHTRKELEGVFMVRDGKAVFAPIKTGIAGDKYFESLSGLKEGDRVIVGPFASVRALTDGAAVTVEQAVTRRPGSPQ